MLSILKLERFLRPNLLFFAVYEIYKKNYSFSRVNFFYLTKIANSFNSKINDSGRFRTTRFSSSRFGVWVTAVPNIFTIYPLHFSIPEISDTLKGFSTNFFGTVRQKIFHRKSCSSPPPPSYPKIFYILEILWSTQWFPYEVFRYCETKQFRQKIVMPAPSLIPNIFRYQKFCETQKGSPTNFFGTVRQKIFEGKSWYFPFSLIFKLFRYQKFSETQHRRVPLRNVSVLWDKNFSTQNRDITLWSIRFFDTRNHWHPKGFPYKICRHCERKKFRQKFVILPSSSTPPPPPPSYP